jgi:putative nucleotidyltransferase with HDIG domain
LNDAVALLGFNEVKLMVMGVSVFEPFHSSIKDPKERYRFWEHSMLCSITSENIGDQIKCEAKDLNVAGLLHDIGKVVLDRYFNEEWCKYLEKQAEDSRSNIEVEEECLGVTHAKIGYLVAERWNLPPNLVECIKMHHNPNPLSPFYKQTCIVSLANVLCKSIASETKPTDNLEIPKDLLKVLNLDNSALTTVLTNVIPRLKGIKALLGTYVVPDSK